MSEMNADLMHVKLAELLSDDRIQADLRAVLAEDAHPIELDGSWLDVPIGVCVEVLARSFHTYEVEMGFGDHYRVLVALGGLKSMLHGIPEPGLCFVTIWYSANVKLITMDFSSRLP